MRAQKFLFWFILIGLLTLVSVHRSYSSNSLQTPEVQSASDSQLLEVGQESRHPEVSPSPAEFKVISYNIRWRGGDDLKTLARLMRDDPEIGGASILGLQEVDRDKKRSGKENGARMLAKQLNMSYAWAAPPTSGSQNEEETGVTILSAYPLTDIRRLVLPHEGPGGRRRAALGATVAIGRQNIRFYSVHSETRISVEKKLEQIKAVLEDLRQYPKSMPAIVLGDLNTWERTAVDETTRLFKGEGFHTPFNDEPTFSRRFMFVGLELKLDWIWLRNLEETRYGIDRKINLSDHWPLWIVLKVKQEPHEAGDCLKAGARADSLTEQ